MPDSLVEIPQSLWTAVCPNCGYSLEGLPSKGICPECGRAIDQSEVILHGWARGRHETIANAKGSRLIRIVMLTVFVVAVQGLQFHWSAAPWFALFLGIVIIPRLYSLARRRATDHPGLIQVRLGEWGCVQYDDLAGPSPLLELWRANSCLVISGVAIGAIAAFYRGWIELETFCFICPVAVIAAPFAWRSCLRFRRAMRQVRDGAIADLNEALCESTPWKNVTRFQLNDVPGGGFRLSVNADFGFFSFRPHIPVDAELRCSSEQASQLRELIVQWRSRIRDTRTE